MNFNIGLRCCHNDGGYRWYAQVAELWSFVLQAKVKQMKTNKFHIEVSNLSIVLTSLSLAPIQVSNSCSLSSSFLGCWNLMDRRFLDGTSMMTLQRLLKTWSLSWRKWASNWTCLQASWSQETERASAHWSLACVKSVCRTSSSSRSPSSRMMAARVETWMMMAMTTMIWKEMLISLTWFKTETSLMMTSKISLNLAVAATVTTKNRSKTRSFNHLLAEKNGCSK